MWATGKGVAMSTSQEIETRYSTGVYNKRDLTIVRGAGTRLWDTEGKEYIDCATGMGVASDRRASSHADHLPRAVLQRSSGPTAGKAGAGHPGWTRPDFFV